TRRSLSPIGFESENPEPNFQSYQGLRPPSTVKNGLGAGSQRPGSGKARRSDSRTPGYFTSTVAPASVNFFLIVSASSLLTPSLMGLGAPSTRSLPSFNPRLVTSRPALITLILLAPAAVRITLNSVFSPAAGAAAAPPPPPPATITGAAAAADTPSLSSSSFTNCDASSSVNP